MPEEPRIGMFVAASLVLLVAPAADNATYQLFMLGLLFNGLTVYVGICYALMGRMLGSWLRSYGGFVRVQRYITGCILIVIGVATVFLGVQR